MDGHPDALRLFDPVFALPPDPMHQADLGVFKHLWEWLKAAIEEKEGKGKSGETLDALDRQFAFM
jgi:hypothetical protein